MVHVHELEMFMFSQKLWKLCDPWWHVVIVIILLHEVLGIESFNVFFFLFGEKRMFCLRVDLIAITGSQSLLKGWALQAKSS